MKPVPSVTLREAVQVLRKHYGAPSPPPTSDAFGLIVWENVAYLASPARRREAFEILQRTVGTTAPDILAAGDRALERATARGILKSIVASKLRECAEIAVHEFGGDLEPVIRGPVDGAKRALRAFPGIGAPGADKILLFTGRQAALAPESNGLRVLVRLGLVREEKSYARTYAASHDAAKDLPATPRAMQQAHLLLQKHGQTLCKHTTPRCEACPLMPRCDFARLSNGKTRGLSSKPPGKMRNGS